jgi:hypothetical protein
VLLGFFTVNCVQAFRSFVIALAVFRADGFSAERDLLGFQYFVAAHSGQSALGFFDEGLVSMFC